MGAVLACVERCVSVMVFLRLGRTAIGLALCPNGSHRDFGRGSACGGGDEVERLASGELAHGVEEFVDLALLHRFAQQGGDRLIAQQSCGMGLAGASASGSRTMMLVMAVSFRRVPRRAHRVVRCCARSG